MTDAWSKSLPSGSSGWNNYSIRQKHPITAGGTQLRAWFQAPPTGVMVLDHASVGIQQSAQNTFSTPVELTFNGGDHGLTLTAGDPDKASDWISIAIAQGQTLISDLDHANVTSSMASNGTTGDGIYHQWGVEAYDQASPGGTWNGNPTSWSHAINRIEVQATTPPPSDKVKRPPVWDALTAWEADDVVRGATDVEFYALQASQGVNPDTEGFPRQYWQFQPYRIGNGYYMTGLAKVGPGGLADRQEALVWYGSQELNIGQPTRPDIPVECWANFQKWTRNDDYRFNEPCPNSTDTPHRGLTFTAIGSGASYARDLGTILAPELKVSTGGSANAGGKITAPGSVAGLFNPQAWNWVFRLGTSTQQKAELGIASSDGQNALYFKREDGASQGTWKCVVVVNGTATEHDTGLSTGTERIWFQIAKNVDLETGLAVEGRFSIGTVSGEFPPGQNVLRKRHAVALASLPDANTLMTAYFSFQNTSAANRDAWLWREWFDLL